MAARCQEYAFAKKEIVGSPEVHVGATVADDGVLSGIVNLPPSGHCQVGGLGGDPAYGGGKWGAVHA